MHYEINVSLNGQHYFGTHERSLRCSQSAAIAMAQHFQAVFPESEGYEVTLSLYQGSSQTVDIK